jgi:MFS family permease
MGLASAATTRFVSVYAIRVGATPLELGLLASLPAIFTLLAATLSGWWMQRYQTSAQAMRWPALGLRLSFPLLFLTPFLPLEWQSIWIIFAMIVPAVPSGIQSVIFLVMIRQAINEKFLTPLISRRNMAMNLTIATSTLVFGFWLERSVFPYNYQIMYGVAFCFAMVGWWHLNRVQTLPVAAAAANIVTTSRSAVWRQPGFRTVAVVAVVIHLGWFAITPVIPLWLVKEFGAAETFIAMYGMAELASASLIALFTSRISTRLGSGNMIALSMLGTVISAGILALAPALHFTLLAAVFGGASWTAASIGLFAFFSEKTSAEARTTTLYMQIISLATFCGPLLGSSLANAGVNLAVVLLGGAAARLAAAVITYICVHHHTLIAPRPFLARPQRH